MNRINNEYIEQYLQTLCHFEEPSYMIEVKKEAAKRGLPVLREPSACFLNVLLKCHGGKKVLEIGTSIGYSSMVLLHALGDLGHIVTIEIDEDMIKLAKKNFEKAGILEKVTLFSGDAGEILRYMEGQFDIIFMDGPKAQYINYLNDCIRLLSPGGLLICDDVLFYGMVANDLLVHRRKITIVKRMRKFLKQITCHPLLETTVIPIGDGMSVSIKK
jgi:predicted O-methyltransferase YrrM